MDPQHCSNAVRFFACNKEYIGCCLSRRTTCHSLSYYNTDVNLSIFNKTYSDKGELHVDRNSTLCEILSFKGCCIPEAPQCALGCPHGNLNQSFLEFYPNLVANDQPAATETLNDATEVSYLSPTFSSTVGPSRGIPQTSTPQSFFSSASAPIVTPTATTGGPLALQTSPSPSKTNTAAIAGGVTGGVVGAALLIGMLAIYCRRRITQSRPRMNEAGLFPWSLGKPRQQDGVKLEETKQEPSPRKLHTS